MALLVKPREARFYADEQGNEPFQKWVIGIRDARVKAKILNRVKRAEKGNFGHYRDLKDGVNELKIDFGPGYRVYFAIDDDDSIILLLGGGRKRQQSSDIERAKSIGKSIN